jgi:hypothetical protein
MVHQHIMYVAQAPARFEPSRGFFIQQRGAVSGHLPPKPSKGDGQLYFEADAFGVLAQAGYRVGVTRGEPEAARWRTLARLFQDEIVHAPPGGEWGSRGSARRLKKLAYTIAALTRNAKRRGLPMERAGGRMGDRLRVSS